MEIIHSPVLLEECLHYLAPEIENSIMLDCTLGEGGHSEAFLQKFPNLKIIGIDANKEIQEKAKLRLKKFDSRIDFYNGWSYDYLRLQQNMSEKPEIILIDLGISVYHYEKSGLGFSFRSEEPLDMRLDASQELSASKIVNSYSEKQLADLIFNYGEERYSRRISKSICEHRHLSPIITAKSLADIIYTAVPPNYRHLRIHPATKTFQALRIAVNNELDALPELLELAYALLDSNGKLGVITFHSLEDRIVKNYFRDLCKKCTCPPEMPICKCGGKARAEKLSKKAVVPSQEEIERNSPSRSAKLRVVRKIS